MRALGPPTQPVRSRALEAADARSPVCSLARWLVGSRSSARLLSAGRLLSRALRGACVARAARLCPTVLCLRPVRINERSRTALSTWRRRSMNRCQPLPLIASVLARRAPSLAAERTLGRGHCLSLDCIGQQLPLCRCLQCSARASGTVHGGGGAGAAGRANSYPDAVSMSMLTIGPDRYSDGAPIDRLYSRIANRESTRSARNRCARRSACASRPSSSSAIALARRHPVTGN